MCIRRLFLALAFGVAGSAAAEPSCITLQPDPDALAARLAALEDDLPGVRNAVVRAASQTESLTDVVDVLVVFDASARLWLAAKNKGTMAAFAARCEEKMNKVLSDSKLLDLFRFRVVGTVELPADLSAVGGLDRVLGRFVTDTGRIVATDEGRAVSAARESLGADIVSVLVSTGGSRGTLGVGYTLLDDGTGRWRRASQIPVFGDWAYNVCSIEAVDEGDTQMHEVAHNMGCDHPDESIVDPYEVYPGPGLFDYSAGYYFWSGGTGYHTVMAYNYGGIDASGTKYYGGLFKPAGVFSSPLIKVAGVPAGDANHDNRRTLAEVFPHVAKYRVSRVPYVEPEPDEPVEVNGVTGAFNPKTARKAVYPYVGSVLDANGSLVAVLQLKIGKANAKKRISKVSGSLVTLAGKKHSIRSVNFPVGSAPKTLGGIAVAGFGTMSLTLGASGFYAEVKASGGRQYKASSAKVGGKLPAGPHAVVLSDDFDLGVDGVIENLLPKGEGAAFTDSSGRWAFGVAAKVKYKGKLVVSGGRNLCAMKLTYKSAAGTFKGSFKAYALKKVGTKYKVVKYKVNVTGLVVEGAGVGRATCRQRSGSWGVTVK